jgi:hypothetical protein
MVKFKGVTRFYSRDNRGKYPMDVHQIRSAFAASENYVVQLRNLRQERLTRIIQADTLPTSLIGSARSVLHLVPASALQAAAVVDIVSARKDNELLLPPGWMASRGFSGH